MLTIPLTIILNRSYNYNHNPNLIPYIKPTTLEGRKSLDTPCRVVVTSPCSACTRARVRTHATVHSLTYAFTFRRAHLSARSKNARLHRHASYILAIGRSSLLIHNYNTCCTITSPWSYLSAFHCIGSVRRSRGLNEFVGASWNCTIISAVDQSHFDRDD